MASDTFDQPRLFNIEPYISVSKGYVYAILMRSQAIKIGWTARSPHVRARELDGGILAYAFGTLLDEAVWHRRLAPYRIGRTEDFWPAPPVWDAVRTLTQSPPLPLINEPLGE